MNNAERLIEAEHRAQAAEELVTWLRAEVERLVDERDKARHDLIVTRAGGMTAVKKWTDP